MKLRNRIRVFPLAAHCHGQRDVFWQQPSKCVRWCAVFSLTDAVTIEAVDLGEKESDRGNRRSQWKISSQYVHVEGDVEGLIGDGARIVQCGQLHENT
ncbi:unnamed protein product [Toxocara canis]|uniref:Uncharacterized protein n=1 Tax=Toxocara canis TaxID=6265 RepID=A0A183V0X7_TOXCA|nr:unnamed protein product [Toxocara canis]